MIVMDPCRLAGVDLNIFSMVSLYQNWRDGDSFQYLESGRPDHGFMLLTCGEILYTESDGRAVSATAGDVIYLPKSKRYRVEFFGEVQSVLINFLLTDPMGRELTLGDDIFCVAHEASEEIRRLFDSIAESYRGAGGMMAQKSMIYDLMNRLFSPSEEADDVIDRCVAYIDSHYAEIRGIADLSAMCGYGETAFRKRFKESMGMSPVHYINAVKIERACRMLVSSETTVNGICEFLGFYDVAYFHKVFKRYTGKTPGEYCRAYQQGEV